MSLPDLGLGLLDLGLIRRDLGRGNRHLGLIGRHLLPPENATGNYVKVVQRVPVKIVFDEPPESVHLLAPGMSVVPEVKVR